MPAAVQYRGPEYGTARVYYGFGNQLTSAVFVKGTSCSNAIFGDPAPRQQKACYIGP